MLASWFSRNQKTNHSKGVLTHRHSAAFSSTRFDESCTVLLVDLTPNDVVENIISLITTPRPFEHNYVTFFLLEKNFFLPSKFSHSLNHLQAFSLISQFAVTCVPPRLTACDCTERLFL